MSYIWFKLSEGIATAAVIGIIYVIYKIRNPNEKRKSKNTDTSDI
jgi:hypothetical protein